MNTSICNEMPQISQAKLYAEHTLAYIFNKLRNHDQIIKNLHELKGDGWRKMKYARGIFDRKIGFVSYNEVNKEFIALIEPFHCKVKTSCEALYNACSGNFEIEYLSEEELFGSCDIIVVQGKTNGCKSYISAELISKIKNEALLVLASDDVSVDEEFLVKTLKEERINAIVYDKLGFASMLNALPNVMIAKQY